MNSLSKTSCGALLALAALGGARAQEAPPILPVEIFVCNYRAGSDAGDLDRVNATYNRWADSRNLTSVTSLLLTPNFHSDEIEADVIGMDIWATGAAMGSGNTLFRGAGSPSADYGEVVDCPSHELFALVGIKPPPGESPTAVFEITNCTVKQNRSADDGIAAVTAVTALWADWGIDDAQAVLFPVAGESSDAGYTFKWLTRYPSWDAFGKVFDHYAAGAVAQAEQIVSPVMTCDSSRMYDVKTIRQMQTND